MNITLTRKEFTRLIELAYMGDWVVTSPGSDDDTASSLTKRYRDLLRRLYRLAASGEDGCPQYVEPDKEDEGEYIPTLRLETDSPASRAIDEFANGNFWDELIARLAERDLDRESSRAAPLSPVMSPEEEFAQDDERMTQLKERYRDEFVRNDLDNLIVLIGADKHS